MDQGVDSDVAGGSALVNFLSDPATLIGLGVVAAGAAYYLSSRATPVVPPVPLGNQSSEVPVSSPAPSFTPPPH